MLKKLSDTKEFKKEFRNFKRDIDTIENVDVKNQATSLLNELLSKSKFIDEGHSPIGNTLINPKNFRETINDMVQIRRSIYKLIRDANR